MAGNVIGDAGEFYRLRVMHLDDTGTPDLEWREDILYREPPRQVLGESAYWRVEVVSVTDDSVVASLGEYDSQTEAEQRVADAQEDLDGMTKSQFDSRFIEP